MAHSKLAVYGATGASVAIAVMKFMVAGITGSSAMLSEGVHSAADTRAVQQLAFVPVTLTAQPISSSPQSELLAPPDGLDDFQ